MKNIKYFRIGYRLNHDIRAANATYVKATSMKQAKQIVKNSVDDIGGFFNCEKVNYKNIPNGVHIKCLRNY